MIVLPHSTLVPATMIGTLRVACKVRRADTSPRVKPPTKKIKRAPPPRLGAAGTAPCCDRGTVMAREGLLLASSASSSGDSMIIFASLHTAGVYVWKTKEGSRSSIRS